MGNASCISMNANDNIKDKKMPKNDGIYRPVAPEQGMLLSELPSDFHSKEKKRYYDRSPWASIIALVNGKFLVQKHTTLTYIPAHTWNQAKEIREGLVSTYNDINRCFV